MTPFIKSPKKVSPKLLPEVLKVAPLLIFKGTRWVRSPNCLAAPSDMTPVFVTYTPPVATKIAGHSDPVVKAAGLLYCSLAAAP